MAVLYADGHLAVCAFQAFTDTTHIYGQQFFHIFRCGSAGTVADFLEDGDMLVDFAGQLQILVLYIFSKSQQNSGAELVIQETALDVAGLGDAGTGIHADEGTVFDSKSFYFLFGRYLFIQQDFHGVKSSLGLLIIVVDMDGSVGQLYGTVVYFAVQRVDTAVFSLDVVRIQAA